jgi:hypothetical protein
VPNPWVILGIFAIFFFSRGYYFWLSDYQIASLSYDSSWWLAFENILNHPKLMKYEYYKLRIDIRFPFELISHKLIMFASKFYNLSLIKINLWITTVIYLFFIYKAYYLGKKELNTPWGGLFYSFSCVQTIYSTWLAYPIFTPKIIGFALYPLLLYALLTSTLTVRNYGYLFCIACWAIFYPVSLTYCLPSIIIGTGIYSYTFEEEEQGRAINKPLLIMTLVSFIIGMSINYLLVKSYPASSKEIFSIFYGKHLISCHSIFNTYRLYLMYLIIFLLVFIIDRRYKFIKNKIIYLYMFISMSFIIISFISYILQNYISIFRTTWLWRSVYYSSITSAMFLFLLFKEAALHLIHNKTFPQLAKIKESIVFLFATLFVTLLQVFSPEYSYSLSILSVPKRLYSAYKGPNRDIEKDFSEIYKALKNQPQGCRFLLPPLNLQSSFSDTIEAISPCVGLLSRGESYNYIFQTELTNQYVQENIQYKQIFKENINELALSNTLNLFMERLNVKLILLPEHIKLNLPFFRPLYKGNKWSLYAKFMN